jgi:hypothetical protein
MNGVRSVDELDLTLVLLVPTGDGLLEPRVLGFYSPAWRVELPERQGITLRGSRAAADEWQGAGSKQAQPAGGARAGLDERSPVQPCRSTLADIHIVRATRCGSDGLGIVNHQWFSFIASSRPRRR